MRAVNLLPRETRSRAGTTGSRRLDPLLPVAVVLTVVVAAAVGGGFVLEHSHAASTQRQLASARAALAALHARQAQGGTQTAIVQPPAVTAQKQPWQAALNAALSSRIAYDDVLAQLARVTPSNVTFSSVTVGAGVATSGPALGPGAGGSLSLAGDAFDEDGVAQLLARLQLVPALSDVTLTSSSADPKSGVVSFVVAAQIQGVTTAFSAPPPGAGA